MMKPKEYRWKAEIYYRHEYGIVCRTFIFERFTDLGEIVEQGPHWDTITEIKVWRNSIHVPNLTVEAAAKL